MVAAFARFIGRFAATVALEYRKHTPVRHQVFDVNLPAEPIAVRVVADEVRA